MSASRILSIAVASICSLAASAQHAIPFDSGWSFTRAGVEHQVTLPRAWNEDDAFRVGIAQLSTDTVRYVKTFVLPRSARGKRVYIEFEGARQSARVWLNGQYVGKHENGLTAFGFDLTPFVHFKGANRLEVLTDNSWDYKEEATQTSFQWNNRNFNANYGGLPKHVRLHLLPQLHQTLPLYSSLGTTGVYVYANDIYVQGRRATVVVESQVANHERKLKRARLQVQLTNPDGSLAASMQGEEQTIQPGQTAVLTASARVDHLRLWSWGRGELYNVSSIVGTDTVHLTTGFRKTQFADGLIRLNDRVFMVHGFAQRTSNEWPGVGMSVPAWLSDYSNGLVVQCGGNLVRWMHTMPWRQDVESCDRVGLLQAMPAGDAEADARGRQWEMRVEAMRDAIIYNRNNPSVVFYECGNKGISEEHMREMKALRDTFDPHGGRAIGSREMLGSREAEYGGEMLYINKSGSKPVWAMEYCRDEALRRYWDNWTEPYHRNGAGPLYRNADASAYNQNQDAFAIEHIRRWFDYFEVRPGTGRRVSSGGVKIVFSDTNTHCRGESNYRTSGVTDAVRLPKDSYYAHRVMWNGWVDPEEPAIYIFGHNNHREGTVKPLYVCANTDSVAVFQNGHLLPAPRRQYHFLFTIDSVTTQPGTLVAIGYNKGQQVCRYELRSAGAPARLQLSVLTSQGWSRLPAQTPVVSADGADMALLQFEVVDADGRRCPTDRREVQFELDGPAEWRGGIGPGEGNCVLAKRLPVECGVNRALVRTTTQTGTIRITARAEGLPDATVTIQSVALTGGSQPAAAVARLFAPDAQWPFFVPSTFDTPPAPPIKRALAVQQITAGCNAEAAARSADDNETTEWGSDGVTAHSWIRYHLEQPERVDELNVKFADWRRRSFPIEVLADDQLVWEGRTPMSLGYVTLPLRAHQPASTITIRLRGAATAGDAFGQITELVPENNERTAEGANRSQLRIIECDLLQHVR